MRWNIDLSDRMLAITTVVIILLVLGGLAYRQQQVPVIPTETSTTKASPVKSKVLANVKPLITSCRDYNGQFKLIATITNTGNVTLSTVRVRTEWRDAAGRAVFSREMFVVSPTDPLPAGESRTFTGNSTSTSAVSCHVIPLDWGA